MWIDDQIIERCRQPQAYSIWVPENTTVVLGRSNVADKECFVENCELDKVPILKRYGGGGAVVLHSGVVVVSVGLWVRDRFNNSDYFTKINQAVIDSIQSVSQKSAGLSQKGVSDLAIGPRKVAGTSLFRSRNYLLYQASVLVDAKMDLIERYLKHPSSEPDYRQKKGHRDFVAGLSEFDLDLSVGVLTQAFRESLPNSLLSGLGESLCDVVPEQCPHLLKRIK